MSMSGCSRSKPVSLSMRRCASPGHSHAWDQVTPGPPNHMASTRELHNSYRLASISGKAAHSISRPLPDGSRMPYLGSIVRTLALWTMLSAVAVAGRVWFLLAIVGLAWTPFSCTTEVRARVAGISGFDFEINETDCDTLAKDASISVFASRTGRAKKTLLLKYGPAGVEELPVIRSIGSHEVQVFIPKISDLMFR
jgi:hypothetical protein